MISILNTILRSFATKMGESLQFSETAKIKTWVFLDLETTGLPQYEQNKTKITELSMVAVQCSHFKEDTFLYGPRVQNKLNLCFNPRKMIGSIVEEKTGLSNFLLEHMSSFTSKTVELLNLYFDNLPRPICLVAHNGNNFDFPILQAEIAKTGHSLLDNLLCIDSLLAFREIDSFKDELDCKPLEGGNEIPFEFSKDFDKTLCSLDYDDDESVKRALEIKKINETTPNKRKGESLHLNEPHSKRVLFGNQSYKLGDIYTRYTNRQPIRAHHAEADVFMLMMSAATVADKFTEWANFNAKRFCDIPPMTPGKKLGF